MAATPWLRLWSDMPNDPKWRTIARASKQSISTVIAVYLHILVNASGSDERGTLQGLCNEDVASALDIDCEQVDAIVAAMQGRVLDGDGVLRFETLMPTLKELGITPDRPQANVWKVIRDRIFKRDDYTCQYCGERGKKMECDHVVPVARGGLHDDDNLATACFACNRSKRDKLVSEWKPL